MILVCVKNVFSKKYFFLVKTFNMLKEFLIVQRRLFKGEGYVQVVI